MRIIQKELLKKLKEIAKKHNVSEQTVVDIEGSIWKYVKKEMSKGVKGNLDSFKNIYIRHLGTIYAHKGKFDNIEKKSKLKAKRKNDKHTRTI